MLPMDRRIPEKKVIEAGEGQTCKNNEKVGFCVRDKLVRGVDQFQDRIEKDHTHAADDEGDDHAEKKSGEDFLPVFLRVSSAVELTEDYRDSDTEPVEDKNKQVHETAGDSHGGESIASEEPADDQGISGVVKLL